MSDIRVLLVDDHRILRDGLKGLLSQENGFSVVSTAGTAQEGLIKARGSAADVAVIDLSLPDHDGFWLLERFREEALPIATIVLSMHSDEANVIKALEAGAQGYLTKAAEPQEVVAAIRTVKAGGSYVQSDVAPFLISALRKKNTAEPQPQLEERECEILRRASRGQSNQKIAEELFVSVSTVKASLRTLFRKLDVSTRTEAVIEAIRRGCIDSSKSKS